LKEKAYTKSTLKYLNIDNMEIRKTHMVWEAAEYETMSVSKAKIKVKLLLGTYILQSNRHQFNKYEVRPDCPLCNSGDEERKHLIVICYKLMEVRQKFIITSKNILYTSMHHNLCDTIFSDTNILTQLILDCTALVYIPHSLHIPIENISRGLLYAFQATRCSFVKDEWIGECMVFGVLLDFTTVKLFA
jgi:hypothetical protein